MQKGRNGNKKKCDKKCIDEEGKFEEDIILVDFMCIFRLWMHRGGGTDDPFSGG